MNSVWLVAGSLFSFVLAYKYYGNYITNRVFEADDENTVPSKAYEDGMDFVPTSKKVLFGHHFASISGTGPIVGPAIAVIWGWLPAVLWVVIGSIFAGCVHDYGSLILSTRKKGVSIGELSESLISGRVKILFLTVILFALWIVVAIFGMLIAVIFEMYPHVVLPVWFQIPVALLVGYLAYRKKVNILFMSIFAVALLYLSMVAGVHLPFVMPGAFGLSGMSIWIIILFAYAFTASILPVWSLLQPRDYINSHQLLVGLSLITLGVFFARPEVVAPAVDLAPEGAPPIMPFLFITIACGAISGFHSLIGSGTSSKQIKKETDARMIGFGGMLTEAFLAILVIVAVTAGIGMFVETSDGQVLTGAVAWRHHYFSWAAADGLAQKVTAFVNGSANMIGSLGIPFVYGQAIMSVLIVSFAGTTLDTATRIQRYILSELAADRGIKPLENRYVSTGAVILAAFILAFAQGGGKGALMLWPLFGSSNQLLAGLVLLILTVYLIKRKASSVCCFLPMVFMVVTSSWAMLANMISFFSEGERYLFAIGGVLLVLKFWMIFEAFCCIKSTVVKHRCARNSIG